MSVAEQPTVNFDIFSRSETPPEVILLVFANEWGEDSDRYLRKLTAEYQALKANLKVLDGKGYQVEAEYGVSPEQLFDLLAEYDDRIVGFHFAGHADDLSLHFEGRDGGPSALHHAGLAARLAGLDKLRWIFLNGCGTAAEVESLHARTRVPVIATERSIKDDVATRFAKRFYADLSRGLSLRKAFDSAQSQIISEDGEDPHAMRSGGEGDGADKAGRRAGTRMGRSARREPARWPWQLYTHPDARRAEHWHLRRGAVGAMRRNPQVSVAVALIMGLLMAGSIRLALYIHDVLQTDEDTCLMPAGDPPDGLVELYGRVLYSDGSPAAGVDVVVNGEPNVLRTDGAGCFTVQRQAHQVGQTIDLLVTTHQAAPSGSENGMGPQLLSHPAGWQVTVVPRRGRVPPFPYLLQVPAPTPSPGGAKP